MAAEQSLVREIKAAEAAKKASESYAAKIRIESEAHRDEAEQNAAATKLLAEATRAEHAAEGLAEAEVMQAKAGATQEQGLAEARVLREKYASEAQGITEKAKAMKEMDGVGREHEEFKLRLDKDKQIEIAGINANKSIAESQALVIGEALKTAKIDIVGGDGEFFNQISAAVQGGKSIDRFVLSSKVATDIKETFFNGSPEYFKEQLGGLIDQLQLKSSDVRDLSVAALVAKLLGDGDSSLQSQLVNILGMAGNLSLANKPISGLLGKK
jgi:hypothetical protein